MNNKIDNSKIQSILLSLAGELLSGNIEKETITLDITISKRMVELFQYIADTTDVSFNEIMSKAVMSGIEQQVNIMKQALPFAQKIENKNPLDMLMEHSPELKNKFGGLTEQLGNLNNMVDKIAELEKIFESKKGE